MAPERLRENAPSSALSERDAGRDDGTRARGGQQDRQRATLHVPPARLSGSSRLQPRMRIPGTSRPSSGERVMAPRPDPTKAHWAMREYFPTSIGQREQLTSSRVEWLSADRRSIGCAAVCRGRLLPSINGFSTPNRIGRPDASASPRPPATCQT